MKKKAIKFWIVLGLLVVLLALAQTKKQTRQTINPIPSSTPLVLTEDEKFILNPPSKEASKSALVKHAQIVAKLAKDMGTLEINNCKPNPLVLNIKYGSELKIQNNDNVKHMLIIDSKHYYELPTNNSLTIKVDFKYGAGDYGYVCEGAGIVGFIHVVS